MNRKKFKCALQPVSVSRAGPAVRCNKEIENFTYKFDWIISNNYCIFMPYIFIVNCIIVSQWNVVGKCENVWMRFYFLLFLFRSLNSWIFSLTNQPTNPHLYLKSRHYYAFKTQNQQIHVLAFTQYKSDCILFI